MTALRKYERLEAIGHWRASPEAALAEVVVSFGRSTLNLTSMKDEPLEHWALAAVQKIAAQEEGALYATDPEAEETLLITDPLMIEAIDTVTAALNRPRKARRAPPWRIVLIAGLVVALALGAARLPNLLRQQISAQTSDIRARALSEKLAGLLGRSCETPEAERALANLARRLELNTSAHPLLVIDGAGEHLLTLPDGGFVIGRALLEQLHTPEHLASEIALARSQAAASPPMMQLLNGLDTWQVLGFLLRGWPDDDALLAALRGAPRLGAHDSAVAFLQTARISTAALGVADAAPLPPALDDQSWVALQGVCDL